MESAIPQDLGLRWSAIKPPGHVPGAVLVFEGRRAQAKVPSLNTFAIVD